MLEGRYRIIRKIAEGGMATVYQALDERLDRTVAIKVMHTQLAVGPHRDQFVERFRREAKSAAAIANPHIVQVYDTGEVGGLDFLVMEFVHGVNLRHEMNEQRTFSVRETLRIVAETLEGLAAAHRVGVVHRDIKPENILLNTRGHVQITDFGLAKAASQATLSSTGMLLGTAAYLAPEMIENNQATPQGDLYSVGIMAWEMLAGEVPFVSDNPVTLVFKHVHEDVPSIADPCPGIDPRVAAFVAHLVARGVDARPADAGVALAELRALSATLDVDAWTYRKPDAQAGHDDAGAAAPLTGLAALAGNSAALGLSDLVAPAELAAGSEPTATAATTALPPSAPADDAFADAGAHEAHEAGASATPTATMPPVPPTHAATSVLPVDAATGTTDGGINATRAMPAATVPPFLVEAMDDAAATQRFSPIDAGDATTTPTTAIGTDQQTPTTALPTGQHAGAAAHVAPGGTKRRRIPRTALIVALVILLVAGAAGGGTAWWYYLGPGSYWSLPQPDDVQCAEDQDCSLAGADWASYQSTLSVSNIPYEVVQDYSDTVEQGRIIAATPGNVGDRIGKRSGGVLHVTVSRGVRQATVPDDILDPDSDSGKDALAALKAAGFTNIVHDESKDQYSTDLPAGAAISVDPEPGSTVNHSDEVTVVLSKGPMPVEMPDIVGKTQADMQAAFDELKLTANITEQYDDKVAKGSVISAGEEQGAQLKWGDTVDVVISRGPQTANVPSGLIGKQVKDVTKQLEDLGFDVTTESILGGLFGTVRAVEAGGTDLSDGGALRLRDQNGKPTVITLTVV